MNLIRLKPGLYTTPDGRWRVERGAAIPCAPRRWWAITAPGATTWEVAAPTLADAKKVVDAVVQFEAGPNSA